MKDKEKQQARALKRAGDSAAAMVLAGTDDVVARVVATDDGDVVASVLATDKGAVVARIAELASQYDIPLVQDAMLTRLLTKVPSGDAIPENLYLSIAEVLSYIYKIHEENDGGS